MIKAVIKDPDEEVPIVVCHLIGDGSLLPLQIFLRAFLKFRKAEAHLTLVR